MTMVRRHLVVWGGILLAGLRLGAGPARAAGTGREAGSQPGGGIAPTTAGDVARLQAEVTRLGQEVREQRQLILQLMQMHDALLKYVQLGNGSAGGAAAAAAAAAGMGTSSEPGPGPGDPFSAASAGPGGGLGGPPGRTAGSTTASQGAGQGAGPSAMAEAGAAAATRAPVVGKVHVTGGALGEAYVYLDGPRLAAAHAPIVEVKQAEKRFVPAVTAVQMGTRVSFPNADRVLHNVFSPTAGDGFDLGPVKAGDRPEPVVMLKPGHVEVFCNIHSRMRADILVTPNGWYTRVRPDGSFQLPGVPVGSQRIVLWGPDVKPVSQRVEVSPGGVSLNLQSESAPARRVHLNKQGGAYGSYER
jgi:plastocyanin